MGGKSEDFMTSLIVTADNGYIIAGSSPVNTWIVKLNSDGSKQWDKIYDSIGISFGGIIRQTADGGYILGGSTGNQPDYKVIALSADGTVLWNKTFGGTGRDELTAIEQTSDGGYILGGYSNSNADGDKSGASQLIEDSSDRLSDYWVLKLTSNGEKEWDRTIGGLKYDAGGYIDGSSFLCSIFQTPEGGYLLGGFSTAQAGRSKTESNKGTANYGTADYWIVKINAKGNRIWDKTIGGNENDLLKSILQTADGGYFLAGYSYSNKSSDKTENKKGEADFWVVKLESEQLSLPQTPIRINAGGADFTTATKKLFIADKYYAGIDRTSSIASGDILNTTNDVFYRSGRCSPSFSYNIPVANGNVDVILHFAEIYYGAPGKNGGKGSRQFHVNMEGSRKLTNFDIFAAAGGAMRAYQQTFPVTVTDGVLNIDFLSGAADLPRVSAIEVLPFQQQTRTFIPVADALVRGGSYQNQNFGSDPLLDVKNGNGELLRTSYLRFAIPSVQQVKSAKLRIYGHNHQSSLAYVVAARGGY